MKTLTLKLKKSDCEITVTEYDFVVSLKEETTKNLINQGYKTLDQLKMQEFSDEFSCIEDLEESFCNDDLPDSFYDRINSVVKNFKDNIVIFEIEDLEKGEYSLCSPKMALINN